MKEVTFTGSIAEVHKQADEWKAANPQAKIIFDGAPIRVGHQDGQSVLEKKDWHLTLKYEESAPN